MTSRVQSSSAPPESACNISQAKCGQVSNACTVAGCLLRASSRLRYANHQESSEGDTAQRLQCDHASGRHHGGSSIRTAYSRLICDSRSGPTFRYSTIRVKTGSSLTAATASDANLVMHCHPLR